MHPVSLAAWRLELTTVFLSIGFLFQYRSLDAKKKAQLYSSLPSILGAG